jgi:hypothetical protein
MQDIYQRPVHIRIQWRRGRQLMYRSACSAKPSLSQSVSKPRWEKHCFLIPTVFLKQKSVINPSADMGGVLREAFRVLEPGGRLAISDLVVRGELRGNVRRNIQLFGCVAGALEESAYRSKLSDAGLGRLMSNLPVSTALRMHGSSSPLKESTQTRLPLWRMVSSSVLLCGQESQFHCVFGDPT